MKIKDGYIVRKIGTKYYAISPAQAAEGGMIALNETGAFIWNLMEEDKTLEDIAAALAAEYEIDLSVATEDTKAYIEMLKGAGALD